MHYVINWSTDWLKLTMSYSPINDLSLCPVVAFTQFVKLCQHLLKQKEKLFEFIPDETKLFS